jgi:hypothetical protein
LKAQKKVILEIRYATGISSRSLFTVNFFQWLPPKNVRGGDGNLRLGSLFQGPRYRNTKLALRFESLSLYVLRHSACHPDLQTEELSLNDGYTARHIPYGE